MNTLNLKYLNLPKPIVFCLVLIAITSQPLVVQAKTKVVGWVEPVRIARSVELVAKIDSGADFTSMNAQNINIFWDKGLQFVSFEVTDRHGKVLKLKKKIIRFSRIKRRKGCQGQGNRRVVILTRMCIGGYEKLEQVNLTDRSHFKFALLVGRHYLKNGFLIDSSKKEITKLKKCKKKL